MNNNQKLLYIINQGKLGLQLISELSGYPKNTLQGWASSEDTTRFRKLDDNAWRKILIASAGQLNMDIKYESVWKDSTTHYICKSTTSLDGEKIAEGNAEYPKSAVKKYGMDFLQKEDAESTLKEHFETVLVKKMEAKLNIEATDEDRQNRLEKFVSKIMNRQTDRYTTSSGAFLEIIREYAKKQDLDSVAQACDLYFNMYPNSKLFISSCLPGILVNHYFTVLNDFDYESFIQWSISTIGWEKGISANASRPDLLKKAVSEVNEEVRNFAA